MSAPEVKKEYMSHAKVMETMGSATSPVFRGKDKASDSEKSTIKLFDLDFGSPKSSFASSSQKRKQSEPVTCELVFPGVVSLQNDLKAATAIGSRLLARAVLDHLVGLHPYELVELFSNGSILVGDSIPELLPQLVLKFV